MLFVVPSVWRKSSILLALCGFLFLQSVFHAAAQITVAWNASSDPQVVGYRIYYGPTAQTYTNALSAGHATSFTLSNLVVGSAYYLALTAVSSNSLESDFSAEVSATVGASDQAPAISSVTNVVVVAGATTPAIPFTVSDPETPATNLIVSGVSDNQSLVKNSSILLAGNGTNRTVSITAASGQAGIANITLSVSDGLASAATAFQVNVRSKPVPPGKIRVSKN